MDIITKSLSLVFSPRQKAIERFAQDAEAIQEQQLHYLLQKAEKTVWGTRYDYHSIDRYETFAERVPVSTYDELKPDILRMVNGERNLLWPSKVRWFAKSSGTTSDKSKFIPVSSECLCGCHYRGGFDSVALYLRNCPESHFFSHKGLILGGSHSPSSVNASVHCGDLSAVLLQNLNPLVNLVRVPKKRIILMDEWESKIKAIVNEVCRKDVNNLSGVPSWMLVLIKAVLEKTGRSYLTEVWPNLEVFFHGGISFAPYREQYRMLIPSDRMHYEEIYNASEGFFGIQDNLADPSLLLMLDYRIFYEFMPLHEIGKEHPTLVPLRDVEVGKNYAMVISTAGGLWRYLIGDTVCFTSCRPYKFIISGRTRHFINAFGEELMVHNADKALAETCRQTGAKVREYTVAPLFLLDKAKGRHQWLIEFDTLPVCSIEQFARQLDQALQAVNSDYEAKRYKEISLQPLEVIVAREGLFYQWLSEKGKLGGQHKIPRLSNDRQLLDQLLALQQKAGQNE
ncbi:MAG: GH3 auxin-responsive promoter family protein [Parabacteroides sp.]